MNSLPHTITQYPPCILQLGRNISDDAKLSNKELEDRYRQVRLRLEKQQLNQVKKTAGPYPCEDLPKGTRVWLYLRGETPVKATILHDFGSVCLIKKLTPGRFQIVQVHKSKISKRLEVSDE
jgi:hypothetical protein